MQSQAFLMSLVFCIFFLFASSVYATEFASESLGSKRSMELSNGDQVEPSPNLVKRKIVFCSRIPTLLTESYCDSNPPDLFRSKSDPVYFRSLPGKYKEFARIFRIAWNAHEIDFNRTGGCNLELMTWQESPIVTALSFETHLDFVKQILKQGHTFKTDNLWDLLREYIHFTLGGSRHRSENPSIAQCIDLLAPCVRALNPETFKIILNYLPEYYDDEIVDNLWYVLVQTAVNRDLILSSYSKAPSDWVQLYYLFSLHFGPSMNLRRHQTLTEINRTTLRLNQLLILQPIFAAIAIHDGDLFMSHYLQNHILQLVESIGTGAVYFWFDRLLVVDQNIKTFDESKVAELSNLADKMFICLCASRPLPLLLDDCAEAQCNVFPQFLLMYSSYARNSLPDKRSQCNLLSKLVKVDKFDFDFMKMVTIIVAFDLKWTDLEEHWLPFIESYAENVLIQGLEIILLVAESFPEDFNPTSPWKINSQSLPSLDVDPESSYLLDAGRIILAHHFKILPISTQFSDCIGEEACFRDLAWFMAFYINRYRPDLGADYKIIIETE